MEFAVLGKNNIPWESFKKVLQIKMQFWLNHEPWVNSFQQFDSLQNTVKSIRQQVRKMEDIKGKQRN